MTGVTIVQAGPEHLDAVAPLFDAYRVFYERPSDPDAVRSFLHARLKHGDSVMFLALDAEGHSLGFTQLYPSWSSVSMKRLWILNDLYVNARARRAGVGRALMERAAQHALDTGARGLVLETAIDNAAGQKLYEKCGWVRDEEFFRYGLYFDSNAA
jgi:GNAT superfamily N-acetyltransferase